MTYLLETKTTKEEWTGLDPYNMTTKGFTLGFWVDTPGDKGQETGGFSGVLSRVL